MKKKKNIKNMFFLGWIDLQKLRIPGVLQRFSITYFVVATTGVAFIETLEPKYAVEVGTFLYCVQPNLMTRKSHCTFSDIRQQSPQFIERFDMPLAEMDRLCNFSSVSLYSYIFFTSSWLSYR